MSVRDHLLVSKGASDGLSQSAKKKQKKSKAKYQNKISKTNKNISKEYKNTDNFKFCNGNTVTTAFNFHSENDLRDDQKYADADAHQQHEHKHCGR